MRHKIPAISRHQTVACPQYQVGQKQSTFSWIYSHFPAIFEYYICSLQLKACARLSSIMITMVVVTFLRQLRVTKHPLQIGYPSMDERERREINSTNMGYEEVCDGDMYDGKMVKYD